MSGIATTTLGLPPRWGNLASISPNVLVTFIKNQQINKENKKNNKAKNNLFVN